MFLPALVCVSVSVSVTTITKNIVDGFVPILWEGSQGGNNIYIYIYIYI